MGVHILILLSMAGAMLGCMQAPRQQQSGLAERRVTVGTVQREIRKGMAASEVLQALGSPNIVSTDANDNEVWTYDKLNTQHASRSSSTGAWLLFIGGGRNQHSSSTSQRTLTIIINFDANKRVSRVSYHATRF